MNKKVIFGIIGFVIGAIIMLSGIFILDILPEITVTSIKDIIVLLGIFTIFIVGSFCVVFGIMTVTEILDKEKGDK